MKHPRLSSLLAFGSLGLLICASVALPPLHGQETTTFNHPGNILISDQFNNRVVEVDRDKNIVWSFGSGDPTLCNPGAGAIIGTNDVERLARGLTLMAGTGIPAGASSFMPNGCVDNRVIVVDPAGNIVFQYGQAGVAGSGPNELNVPVFALQTPSGDYLITDQGNNRVILVSPQGQPLFACGPPSGPCALNNPNSAELLANGKILIADENNSRVIEVDKAGNFTVDFSAADGLNIVAFASRLPNGDTLITDSGNNRIVEFDPAHRIVFQYSTNTQPGSNPQPLPTNAVRLKNGATLIADQFNDRVLIVSPFKAIRFQYGMLNVIGNGPNQLDAPYNAMSICDYTGVTRPPGVECDDNNAH